MKNILLLSNDSSFMESFKDYVKDNSFFKFSFNNSIKKIVINNYDLIIIDYFMSEYDGYDYLKIINNKIKVIILLPYYIDNVIKMISSFNISYILIKPVIFSNLLDKIDIICNNKRNYKEVIDKEILKLFSILGLSFKYRGVYLLYRTIFLVINDNVPINIDLYNILSKECGDTKESIERNIRYAIQVSCSRMSPFIIDEFFGNIYNQYTGLIGNLEFINVIVKNIIIMINKKD